MTKINIRKANSTDLPVLLAFEQEIIAYERPFDSTLDDDINYYDIEAMITSPEVALLVVTNHEKIIASGYARIMDTKIYVKHAKKSYLGFMYVIPEFRGKGINGLLIEELKKWSLTQGIDEVYLDVYNQNEGAIKAYQKAGFSKHLIEMRHKITPN
jgi:ribosomal protein S18 acetylase RimI-like enzyme